MIPRPTIAVLFDSLFDDYEARLLAALRAALLRRGARLAAVVGGSLNAPSPVVRRRNVLYDLITADNFDGLIVVSGCVGNYIRPEDLAERLRASYGGLPLVSIGTPLPGVPSVSIDNRGAMHALMAHMIERHGVRRPAFVSGPPGSHDARERLAGFCEALARYGLAHDPRRLVQGDFLAESGAAAVAELLARNVPFDALIAANDPMAASALHALKERTGRDWPVTGFDDVREALSVTPTLTTVHQPTDAIAEAAAELMLERLADPAGRPGDRVLPARLVIRHSCGCQPTLPLPPRPRRSAALPRGRRPWVRHLERRHPALAGPLGRADWAEGLLDALERALRRADAGAFVGRWRALIQAGHDAGLVEAPPWYELLADLADAAEAGGAPAARRRWLIDAAGRTLLDTLATLDIARRERAERATLAMHRLNHDIVASFDLDALRDIVGREFRRLGLRRGWVSLYADAGIERPGRHLHAVVDLEHPERAGGAVFPAERLVPGGLRAHPELESAVILSLFSADEYLGLAVLELGDLEAYSYEMLGAHLSAVLKGHRLLERLRSRARHLEAEVALRTRELSEANRRLEHRIARHRATLQKLRNRNRVIRRLNRELVEKSKVDVLTGLLNRKAFFELVQVEIDRARRAARSGADDAQTRFALMMIDIDHFKAINDRHGHLTGDRVLRRLGELLKPGAVLRRIDLAGRYGGEEFVVAMPQADLDSARRPAERLVELLRQERFHDEHGRPFGVTVSIGIAAWRVDELDLETLLQRADEALYAAKRAGRDRVAVHRDD
ncbi:MAG: hypothetical protein KatS3mg121_0581 [Gammaproteobacteria bacterium]|nr:MAG: hypothetical protein KatS3mg121_0581 [Gammaproteobacteria bacterium]